MMADLARRQKPGASLFPRADTASQNTCAQQIRAEE